MSHTYDEKTYEVKTIAKENGGNKFVLYIDNHKIITATELEREGVEFDKIPINWTETLRLFAQGYIDSNYSISKGIERIKYYYPSI